MHPASNIVPRIEDEENENSLIDPRDEGTADDGIKRDPSLIRHTGKHPFNAEPPLELLMRHGFITPAPVHYVRSHGPVPAATWSEWTVEVCGLVKWPTKFTMDQLIAEFKSVEFPATLVCSANRRKELSALNQTVGFNWGAAAISTSIWRGVPLRDVLGRCGISKEAVHVCFEGGEDLSGGGGSTSKYGTSIREEVAMDPTRDIVLAYLQNGERLPPDHGFPVRMILPGFTGGRMVKWLKRIIVTDQESDNYYHRMDNRMLPSYVVDFDLANSEGCLIKPEYVIYEMNINSVITAPCHGQILAVDSPTPQRSCSCTVRGFAFSGGGRKVTRVEMTLDGGVTWQLCELEHVEKPNKFGKYWCWCFWSLEVRVVDLFEAEEIAVRAWDESNNTQPENLNWNLMGMLNNSWFRVKITICKSDDEEITGIQFHHPTLPGNQSGGWMETDNHPIHSSPQTQKKTNAISPSSSNTYSTADVKAHNSPESSWIVVHGHVYDCTRFLHHHPGGTASILINAGTDCTDEFRAIHSDKATNMLEDYRIGKCERDTALVPQEKICCELISKTSITPSARLFRFALPSQDQVLGLPVGNHIFLSATIHGKVRTRAYTPTSAVDEARHFDLVVKIYLKNANPGFPNGGLMSQHLDSLPIGSKVEVKGPAGHIEYTGRGNFIVHGELKFAKKLAMVAGGTGIAPIYQVVQAVLKDPADETEMFVVYGNRREEEILLREELDSWGEKDERLKTWYVVEESGGEGWRYSVGVITDGVLREHIPVASEHTLALACGPPAMIETAVKPMLERLNYDTRNNSLLVF